MMLLDDHLALWCRRQHSSTHHARHPSRGSPSALRHAVSLRRQRGRQPGQGGVSGSASTEHRDTLTANHTTTAPSPFHRSLHVRRNPLIADPGPTGGAPGSRHRESRREPGEPEPSQFQHRTNWPCPSLEDGAKQRGPNLARTRGRKGGKRAQNRTLELYYVRYACVVWSMNLRTTYQPVVPISPDSSQTL